MNLDSAVKQIELVLGEAMTTTECDWITSYAVLASSTFVLGASDGTTNGTTAIVAVAAPPAGQWRQVKEVRLHNSDTVTHQVTLQLNNAGTLRIVTSQSIPPGGDFLYTVESGVAASGGSAPALLVESGAAAKIPALPAFNLAAPPTGAEPLAAVEGGTTVQVTLAQLYTLFAGWLDFVATNPLDAPGGSGSAGLPFAVQSGVGDGVGAGGDVALEAGAGGATSGNGGQFSLQAGAGGGTGNGGTVNLIGARSGAGATGNGGSARMVGGDSNATDGDGGDVRLAPGVGAGTGRSGLTFFDNLPTAAPADSHAVWEDTSTTPHTVRITP